MDHWDEVARATPKRSASWYEWCERHGFDEFDLWQSPHGRKFWSREHFKAALSAMPANHPDRWKYEVGAKYAPFRFAAAADDPREFWFAFFPLIIFIIVPIMLTPILTLITWVVPLGFGVYWALRAVQRYRILST